MAFAASNEQTQAIGNPAHAWMLMIFLGGLYIGVSASLISFNKYLIHEDRFPYAVTLVMLHMGFAAVMSFILLQVRPSMFPSRTDPEKRVPLDLSMWLKNILPIGVLFSGQLVLSNWAYLHTSVAFLQMMKEANLVMVYLLSLLAMLEVFRWRSVFILIFIVCATSMTIVGELNFSMAGFMMQGSSQLFECSKIVLQALLLAEGGRKLDAMTFVLVVTPVCFCVLAIVQCTLYFVSPEYSFAGAWPHFEAWWPYLLGNCINSFLLNVVIAFFIKHSSAVGFILAGITKDVIIVSCGWMMFHEQISILQAIGFSLQLVGILVWSLVKTFPDRFEDSFWKGILRTFCLYPEASGKEKLKGYGAA